MEKSWPGASGRTPPPHPHPHSIKTRKIQRSVRESTDSQLSQSKYVIRTLGPVNQPSHIIKLLIMLLLLLLLLATTSCQRYTIFTSAAVAATDSTATSAATNASNANSINTAVTAAAFVTAASDHFFYNLVDFWVIKIKKPMILCARNTSISSEQNTKFRSRSEKICLFSSQNNQLLLIIKYCRHICLRNAPSAQRFVDFFLDCAFRVLIGTFVQFFAVLHTFLSPFSL